MLPSARRSFCRYIFGSLVVAIGITCLFSSAPALAVNEYPFVEQLTGASTPQETFSKASSVAVDGVSGDVLVADSGPDVVQVFDSSGKYVTTWTGLVTPSGSFGGGQVTVATNNGTGDVYVTDSTDRVVDVLSSSGAYLGQLTGASLSSPQGVAVDQASGAVYVADEGNVVDVFDSAGIYQSRLTGTPSGPFRQVRSVAVDDASGDVFLAESGSGVVYEFTAAGTYVTTLTGANTPGGSFGGGSGEGVAVAANNSSGDLYVVDGGHNVVDQLSSLGVYEGQITGTPGGSFAGLSGVAVGQATGRVYVADVGTSVVDVFGAPVLVPLAPSIESTSARNVGSTSVDLVAGIDPNGFNTTYHFEYGAGTSYGTSSPVPDADIGAGAVDQTITQHLSGLTAGVTYHYRLVAHNVNGTTTGVDHTFVYDTTPGGLPDGRFYEMVTPPDKEGAVVHALLAPTVAADGSRVVGSSTEAFAGLTNDELGVEGKAYYRFTRTAAGWVTAPLNPFRSNIASIGVEDSVWSPSTIGTRVSVDDLSLVRADGSVSEVGPIWPPGVVEEKETERTVYSVSGAASDASRGIVFAITNSALFWPFDSTIREPAELFEFGPPSLYEYTGTGNLAPSLVGVTGGAGSTSLISQCGIKLGSSSWSEYNSVSQSGATVFFTAEPGGCENFETGEVGKGPAVSELYARIDGSQTVAISEPSAADCPACDTSAPAAARFEGAAADGSKVFFTTTQSLLGADTSENLYEYDFNPPPGQPKVVKVSGGDSSVSNPTAEVQGVTRISQDGSHIYFVAGGVLTTAANREGQSAQSGADNLYVYERDAQYPAGRTAFIAGLCSDAEKSGAVADTRCPSNLDPSHSVEDKAIWGLDTASGDHSRPAQATPDGHFLTFTSYGDLTTGDTSSARQVFQYDAQTGSLARLSIGHNGYNDNGNTASGGNSSSDAEIVTQEYKGTNDGGARGGGIARTMSDDGSYVFFQSPIALTSRALNDVQIGINEELHPIYAQNVYEYHGGQISLISDGKDGSPVLIPTSGPVLIGTSETGGDVFFRTADPLVAQDTDTQVDIYDARVGGGFPAPAAPTGCQGDACQGSPSSPPVFPSSSSSTLSGLGNLMPPESTPVVKPPSVSITNAHVKGNALLVTVKTSEAGTVKISGAGLNTTVKKGMKAGTHQIKVPLTRTGKTAKKHHKKIKVKASLTVGKQAATKTATVKA